MLSHFKVVVYPRNYSFGGCSIFNDIHIGCGFVIIIILVANWISLDHVNVKLGAFRTNAVLPEA